MKLQQELAKYRESFPNRLPDSQLGKFYETFSGYQAAVSHVEVKKTKEYTLVVVTDDNRRILIGKKNRGFGKGMFNSFGGKIEPGESPLEGACRELKEETNIDASPDSFKSIGVLRFILEDAGMEMVVHVFRILITEEAAETNSKGYFRMKFDDIQGCEEITPQWVNDWYKLPLNNMFADDSIWMPYLLKGGKLNGWFLFAPGGEETNTILHYHIEPKGTIFTMEQRLFHALKASRVNSPTIKEYNEAFAFCNAVRSVVTKDTPIDVVIDVAGGHGALAALFLVFTEASVAVVVDPADVSGKDGVQRAWREDFLGSKVLQYRHECLRKALPEELAKAIRTTGDPSRVLVVACHACQHLSEETLAISCRFGAHVAVMPCCQKDSTRMWKSTCKTLGVPFPIAMDLLLVGKAMSWEVGKEANVYYDVRVRTIDKSITPQNRVIICKSNSLKGENLLAQRREVAHRKLQTTYERAHANSRRHAAGKRNAREILLYTVLLGSGLGVGCVLGAWGSQRKYN